PSSEFSTVIAGGVNVALRFRGEQKKTPGNHEGYRALRFPSLLLLGLLFELGVDDVLLFLRRLLGAATTTAARAATTAAARRSRRLVHLLRHLVRRLLQLVERGLERRRVLAGVLVRLEHLLGVLDPALDLGPSGLVDLVAVLADHLFHLEDERVELIARLDRLLALLVLGLVRLGVLHHLLDVRLAQARRSSDRDLLLL